MYDIPAVIFAGGKSSRMGMDKALLPFGGYNTLSEFQYKKLKRLFNSVYLSSKENKFDFKCDLILDTYQVSSPLVGLLSIFETLHCDRVLVLSVDAPLVDEQVFNTLIDAYDEEHDAVIAKSPKGLQPLCGIYNHSIMDLLQKAYENDEHKLTKLLHASNMKTIPFDDEVLFTNLNYRKEYEKLLLR